MKISCAYRPDFLFVLLISACTTSHLNDQSPQVFPADSAVTALRMASQSELVGPAELFGELFVRVQLAPVFPDSKYFVDMTPQCSPNEIMGSFAKENPVTKNELSQFVAKNFTPPANFESTFTEHQHPTIESHIKTLWTYLRRSADSEQRDGSSLIPLPSSYIVPGGRFREIYYWDSYFTQLGLLVDHEDQLFKNMVTNFAYLENRIGHIPNGNRTYYLGRSQPPFFSYMISLWRDHVGKKSAGQFLVPLQHEYDFWMKGAQDLKVGEASARVVRLGENDFLNRNWDDAQGPRPEAYKEDVQLAKKALELYQTPIENTYRELRAGAESGWDYSTRWFQNPRQFASIQTTSLLPVDLNSLLVHTEELLAQLYRESGDERNAKKYHALADSRKRLIQKYMWNEARGTFMDYNFKTHTLSSIETLAMAVPLFVGVVSPTQAARVAKRLESDFLKAGGLVTTSDATLAGQQWDTPNGWAPLQWMAYAGLKRYHQDVLAEKIRTRWLSLNEKVFMRTGRLMEKYNVIDLTLKSGGGEYPSQDGFGWTNGVYLALKNPRPSLRHVLTNR